MGSAQSDEITIRFDSSKCIHARRCVLGLPDVFKPGTPGGWMFPQNARGAEIARVIDSCPSGALSYTRHDGGLGEQVPPVNTIRLWENGPNEVRGDVTIEGEDPATRVLLCRCGKSKNKPFCDNSHREDAFTASSEPAARDGDSDSANGGTLAVTPLPNGPVKVEGNCEIVAGSGRRVARGERFFLCRCGASKTKPFCDGSHSNIGFEAE